MLCSILNDVIGPVMTGPSSSHTAAPTRIGQMARAVFGEEIVRAVVSFDPHDSFAHSYHGQGSDFGFTGGLLGWNTEDPRLPRAVELAPELGLEIRFQIVPLPKNAGCGAVRLELTGRSGRTQKLMANSLGGGMFRLAMIDEFPVDIHGELDLFIAYYRTDAALGYQRKFGGEAQASRRGSLLVLQATHMAEVGAAAEDADCLWFRQIPAMVAVKLYTSPDVPFATGTELAAYAERNPQPLWRLAVEYETALGAISAQGMMEDMGHKLDCMQAAVDASLSDPDAARKGFLAPSASRMRDYCGAHPLAGDELTGEATVCAVAVMETNGRPGVIVAAPTGGSCGVLPGAVLPVAKRLGVGREETVQALLAAGLVGAMIGNEATFDGAVGGCQAEIGSATAMAAAAVAVLLGGTTQNALDAASLAIQNQLGLVCDPVACQTETPCIGRNAQGAAAAILAARMVMGGFPAMIPLGEVIPAMYKVGLSMGPELLCNGEGGVCITPTARRIAEAVKA